MGLSTSKWKLWYPTGTDRVLPTSRDFALMQTSTDTALSTLESSQKSYADSTNAQSVNVIGRTVTSFRPSSFVQKGYMSEGATRIVVLGDSKGEGVGATSEGARWQSVLRDSLRDRLYGADGDRGVGYIPVQYGQGFGAPMGAVMSGAVTKDYDYISTAGIGMRAVLFKTVGTTSTYKTFKARYLTLHFTTGGSLSGSFDFYVNGVKRGSYSCSTGLATATTSVNIDLGSVMDASVKIVCSTANAQVEGVTFRTDTSTGLTLIDAAHSGWRADWFDTAPGWELNMTAIASYNPHLIVIALGGNDMGGNWGTPIPASSWGQSLLSLYNKFKDRCPNAGILFLHAAMRCEDARSATPQDYPAKLTEYENAARLSIGNLERAGLLYESTLWQPLNANPADPMHPKEQDPSGWLYDQVHPSDYGHAVIGGFLTKQISETIPSKVWDGGTL